jgi:hypothetical protein
MLLGFLSSGGKSKFVENSLCIEKIATDGCPFLSVKRGITEKYISTVL